MATITYLKRSDKSVAAILNASFPEYKGNRISARISETIRFDGTQWDEGCKRDYVVVQLSNMTARPVQEASGYHASRVHTTDFPIPDGFVVVTLSREYGQEHVEIVAPTSTVTPLLPAPVELPRDEMIVLIATRKFVSSYRFDGAAGETRITRDRWEAAKTSLITKKLLNKAGAITTEGRNVAGSKELYAFREAN